MADENVRALSKEVLLGPRNWDMVKNGAILRIADAMELMAKRYEDLIRDRDYYKGRTEDEERTNRHLRGSNASLRGVITRLEKRLKRSP